MLGDIHRFTIESHNALTSGVKGFFPAGKVIEARNVR
jgi:hypothetical protein